MIMAAILAAVLTLGVFLGPLLARLVLDRRADSANVVAAQIRSAVRRRLGGDSMISVLVEPKSFLQPGRIRLSAPSGYEGLIETVWPAVVKCVPAGYELVVRPAPPRRAPAAAESPRLSRAA
jgi:hypothetical protein